MPGRGQPPGIAARRRWLVAGKVASAALLAVAGGGCAEGASEESSEESCEEVDAIESTFAELGDVDVSDDGADQIGAIARDLADEVDDLADEARGELDDEIDALASSVDDLADVVNEGSDDASVRERTAELVDRLGDVGAAVVELADAAADIC
jgi:methyl-accepting chemotaxis protein